MAYDASTSTVVLFGRGAAGGAETWTWDGMGWTKQTPRTSPPASAYNAMAYDPVSSAVVLYTTSGETWLWKGSTLTWTKQATKVAPPARPWAAMAYDPAARTVVLFGGGYRSEFSDTWTWNGATRLWTKQNPTQSPDRRARASMATDPATGTVMMYGGFGATGVLDDTWVWHGATKTWAKASPAVSPPARGDAGVASDDTNHRVVLFGGGDQTVTGLKGDTWVWDGAAMTWTPQIAAGPSIREGVAMTYDAARRSVVLFGGLGEVKPCDGVVPYSQGCGDVVQNNQFQSDTWTYSDAV